METIIRSIEELRKWINTPPRSYYLAGAVLVGGGAAVYAALATTPAVAPHLDAAPRGVMAEKPLPPATFPAGGIIIKQFGNFAEIRDPFTPLSSTTPAPVPNRPVTTVPAATAGGANGEKPTASLPTLVGIVIANGQQAALIRWEGKTGTYQLRERVGQEQLTAVDRESVTLSGPTGERILKLGR